MPSYSVYQQISFPQDHTYKFLQLPPKVLDYIKNNKDGELSIKSSPLDHDKSNGNLESHLVLTTGDQTWKLRQMNHSNTVLLLNNLNINERAVTVQEPNGSPTTDNKLIGFARGSYEYELTSTTGSIDFSNLPVYSGTIAESEVVLRSLETVYCTVEELLQDSPISRHEYFQNWYEAGGCEVNGNAYVLDADFTTEVLSLLITVLMGDSFDYRTGSGNLDELATKALDVDSTLNHSTVNTVIHKFASVSEGTFTLNNSKIAKWYGVQVLKKMYKASVSDFLLSWKSALPAFYNVSLDIQDLRGYYHRSGDFVRFVDPKDLSPVLQTRFTQLFQLDKAWDYEEFKPFILDLVPPGKKIDSLIIKYGRKKKVGKEFIVCPR